MAQKFYVVWIGLNPGVYDSWEACRQQVEGWKGAVYKGFATREEAEEAINQPPEDYIEKKAPERAVYLGDMEEKFHFGPMLGTNNIGEFLAIVHALALYKSRGLDWPLYSDSRNAILWVKAGKCRTKLERTAGTEAVFERIESAERWLKENSFRNPILKWETDKWGEIPADFGRK